MAMRFDDNTDDAIVAEINITPLTDVALVLLIIFMIGSTVMLESGLPVKLPTAKTTSLTSAEKGKPIYVTISKEGQISVNEKIAKEDELTNAIKQAVANATEKTVIIRGDESVVLGKAVRIMDAARSAGADKIAIAAQPTGK